MSRKERLEIAQSLLMNEQTRLYTKARQGYRKEEDMQMYARTEKEAKAANAYRDKVDRWKDQADALETAIALIAEQIEYEARNQTKPSDKPLRIRRNPARGQGNKPNKRRLST